MIKLEIIKRAFRKLNLVGASSDPSIPQYDDALIDLEFMMSEWDERPSVNTGYNSTGTAATLDEPSGLTIGDIEAVSNNLAVRIANDYRIEVPQDVRALARSGLSNLIKRGAVIPCPSYTSRTPRGLGNVVRNVYWYGDSYYNNEKPKSDAIHVKRNDITNYVVEFSGWLAGNTLATSAWSESTGSVTISNQAIDGEMTSARLSFCKAGNFTILIRVTDNTGQATTQCLNFYVNDVVGAETLIAAATTCAVEPTFISETPPSNPVHGTVWYKPSEGKTYIYYIDSDSAQWVQQTSVN